VWVEKDGGDAVLTGVVVARAFLIQGNRAETISFLTFHVQPSNSRVTSPAGSPFQTSLEKMGLFEPDEEVSTTMATGVGGGRCGKELL
jgi:hypothetical protein